MTLALKLALIGAVAGSFIGLASLRLPVGAPIALSRSRCTGCSRTLGAADLVPLLSYAWSRGRCRTCGSPIEARYPLVELASIAIGAASALLLADGHAVAAALLGWWLLLLALLDAEHYWLPDPLTYPLIVAGLGAALYLGAPTIIDSIIGTLVAFILMAGVAVAYKKLRGRDGLGGGDWKLFAAAGAWVGWYNLPLVLLIASLVALAAALILHSRKAAFLQQRLPFGAFLAPALWLLYLVGPGR
jgi:leader peptidase (prepilin peptidase)/N-methyltransferase